MLRQSEAPALPWTSLPTCHSASAAPPRPPAGRSGHRHGRAWEQQLNVQSASGGAGRQALLMAVERPCMRHGRAPGHDGAAQGSRAHSIQSQRTFMLLYHATAPVRLPPVDRLCPTCCRRHPAIALRHATPPQLMLALPWPLDRSSLRHCNHACYKEGEQARRQGTL